MDNMKIWTEPSTFKLAHDYFGPFALGSSVLSENDVEGVYIDEKVDLKFFLDLFGSQKILRNSEPCMGTLKDLVSYLLTPRSNR